ncbi:cAMP-binding protein [Fulvivirga imtechensis AK7]|uniref:cAMP-binding protein n=1 Tax=Fulvivirga imtechensis AK7 TaxID=1237149 RepID=L8JWA0_9BACT|nr:cAMP-binding protein [Fulvivirga imtechensis AK7]
MDAIKNTAKIASIRKNDFFLREGEISTSVAFIEQGSMRLFYNAKEKEVCNDFFFENSVIGSFGSFMAQTPSLVNIAAIENCELVIFKHEDVMALIEQYTTIKRLSDIIIQEQFLRSEKREASLLRLNPEERFKNLLEEHPKIFKRIPLRHVASYLNITPETLSRYRAKFSV